MKEIIFAKRGSLILKSTLVQLSAGYDIGFGYFISIDPSAKPAVQNSLPQKLLKTVYNSRLSPKRVRKSFEVMILICT